MVCFFKIVLLLNKNSMTSEVMMKFVVGNYRIVCINHSLICITRSGFSCCAKITECKLCYFFLKHVLKRPKSRPVPFHNFSSFNPSLAVAIVGVASLGQSGSFIKGPMHFTHSAERVL